MLAGCFTTVLCGFESPAKLLSMYFYVTNEYVKQCYSSIVEQFGLEVVLQMI